MLERDIFMAALEKDDPAQRAAHLDQACGADATLRQRVEALLRVHERTGDFMDVPVMEQLSDDHTELKFLAPSQNPDAMGRLGHYEVLEVVGRGGMGTVFRALDTKLHRVVALKVLSGQLAGNRAARQRFVREARAAAAVTHDHIIAIYAVEDAGPVPYLVMQFIDGPTLQKKLDRVGQLSLKEILRIGLQISEGLSAAHRQGLVHRDIKPANILLENGIERVKITDFGLARAGDDASLTHSGAVAGTPMYMSPEQADGSSVDFRSDLFSLGSVMYAMCTGLPPFRAPGSLAVLKRVCEETPRAIGELNPELPPWLGELVERLHAKSPQQRFGSAREVADLLARRLAETQQGGVPAAQTPRRQRGVRTAALGVVALFAGLGVSEWIGLSDIRGRLAGVFSRPAAPSPPAVLPTDPTAWERAVAALPPDQQIKALAARLRDLNPGFDGTVTPTITDDGVSRLRLSTDQVTNIAPVRALRKLSLLDVSGTEGTMRVPSDRRFLEVAGIQGKLVDLSPLKGMTLSVFSCNRTRVADLSPLKGMPLTWLACGLTDVSDLTPLAGMSLTHLLCGGCSRLSDIGPLSGMRLIALDLGGTGVSDVSLLRGMPLTELNLNHTRVTDLWPLTQSPLELLNLGRTEVTDLSPLETMTTLHTLVLDNTAVTDLSRLKNLPLKSLRIQDTKVSDLTPLKGMPLKEIWLDDLPALHAEVLRALTGLERINGKPAADFWRAREK
jgi:eukaryotic-like serine/threonine-protein kinase